MRMIRRGQAQRALQQDLARGGIKQVSPTHHVGDALRGVIHDHCQLIRPKSVCTTQDEVADVDIDALLNVAMHEIGEPDVAMVGYAEANRWIGSSRGRYTTSMDAASRSQVGATAVAFKCHPVVHQLLKGFAIKMSASALAEHGTVMLQPKTGQCVSLRGGGAGDFPRWIEILDAQQPLALRLSRKQPASKCGQHRASVQRAGG